jgi:hypothetical protein
MQIQHIVLIIAGAVLLFFLTREFWCWYWKINERVNLLKSIDESLKKKLVPEVKKLNNEFSWKCPSCFEEKHSDASHCSCGYVKQKES